jgi:hypothetical protein
VRVVYMSGYSFDAILENGVLADGAHFLQKPFTRRALQQPVQKLLRGQDKRSA